MPQACSGFNVNQLHRSNASTALAIYTTAAPIKNTLEVVHALAVAQPASNAAAHTSNH
jgi:hypothetical protein